MLSIQCWQYCYPRQAQLGEVSSDTRTIPNINTISDTATTASDTLRTVFKKVVNMARPKIASKPKPSLVVATVRRGNYTRFGNDLCPPNIEVAASDADHYVVPRTRPLPTPHGSHSPMSTFATERHRDTSVPHDASVVTRSLQMHTAPLPTASTAPTPPWQGMYSTSTAASQYHHESLPLPIKSDAYRITKLISLESDTTASQTSPSSHDKTPMDFRRGTQCTPVLQPPTLLLSAQTAAHRAAEDTRIAQDCKTISSAVLGLHIPAAQAAGKTPKRTASSSMEEDPLEACHGGHVGEAAPTTGMTAALVHPPESGPVDLTLRPLPTVPRPVQSTVVHRPPQLTDPTVAELNTLSASQIEAMKTAMRASHTLSP